jgi:hypothetical protein
MIFIVKGRNTREVMEKPGLDGGKLTVTVLTAESACWQLACRPNEIAPKAACSNCSSTWRN